MTIGTRLHDLVVAYDSLGTKRTGGPNERAVCDWFADELRERGADVELQAYQTTHWHEDLTVEAGGDRVDAITLGFSGVGEAVVEAPRVEELTLLGELYPVDVDERVAEVAQEVVGVLSTPGPRGRLVAINRAIAEPGGPPIVLVAVRDAERVARHGRLSVRTWTSPGTSHNVVARLGPAGHDPVVLVSPLTGWFRCAAERGCGLAMTLELASRLAREHAVLVVAATGHENDYVGSEAFLADYRGTPRAVVHLGASLAALDELPDGSRRLSPNRFAMFDGRGLVDETVRDRIVTALADAELGLLDLPVWPGEGEAWRRFGGPVLSATGAFDRFHTPEDVVAEVTTPDALARVFDSLATAVDILLGALTPNGSRAGSTGP